MFGALIFLSSYNEFLLLDRYITSIPRIAEERGRILNERAESIADDCSVRAELAVLLYGEYDELSPSERLEPVRDAVSARSVTLVGPDGSVLESTDPEIPSLMPAVDPDRELSGGEPVFGLFRSVTEDEAAEEDFGFHSIAALREIPGSDGHKLIVETDTSAYDALTMEYGSWETILERML